MIWFAHLHTHPRLLECSTKRWKLIDLICFFQGHIDRVIPPAWIAFAADVVEVFNTRRDFVEGSQDVAQLEG